MCTRIFALHWLGELPWLPRGRRRGGDLKRNEATHGLLPQILVAQKVTSGVYKGVTTSELDELAAETAAALTSTHPDYAVVSGAPLRMAAGIHACCTCMHACRPISLSHRRLLPYVCGWIYALLGTRGGDALDSHTHGAGEFANANSPVMQSANVLLYWSWAYTGCFMVPLSTLG